MPIDNPQISDPENSLDISMPDYSIASVENVEANTFGTSQIGPTIQLPVSPEGAIGPKHLSKAGKRTHVMRLLNRYTVHCGHMINKHRIA